MRVGISDGLTVSFWAAEGRGAIARDHASFDDRQMKARPYRGYANPEDRDVVLVGGRAELGLVAFRSDF